MTLIPSSSQTVGPFFSIGLQHLNQNTEEALAKWPSASTVCGSVVDGDGNPIPDCVLEFFTEGFFARVPTTACGSYKVVAPPQIMGCEVLVFMRGLLRPALTRLYLTKQAATNDAVISSVPEERQATLFARAVGDRQLEWNVRMQGEDETVFFDA